MMRSMFSGVSGLRTHQTKMDVIAHNISNVNTVGFKSSRVTFNDVFSQTISGASRANENTGKGGTNPMQIGLGVNVSSIDKNMSTGAAQRTDRALDLMINGDGFFVVSDGSGTYFTRAGAFDLDEQGYLVMGNGMRVNGWDTAKKDGHTVIQPDLVRPIQIAGEKEYVSPTTSTYVDVRGNLNAEAIMNSASGEHVSSLSVYDSIGNRWVIDCTYKYTPAVGSTPASWELSYGTKAYLNGNRNDTENTMELGAALPSTTIAFDTNGRLISGTAAPGATGNVLASDNTITLDLSAFAALTPIPADFGEGGTGTVTLDLSNLTQFGNETTSGRMDTIDGNSPGTLQGLSVGSDGIITGRYSNGETMMLGQIPIAQFKNPAGLQAMGNNLYVTTANSGDFDGRGIETGDMMGGVLEMSNVDLSSEFTEMITTQRGFQASSRLITTSDEMLQELVNLKR